MYIDMMAHTWTCRFTGYNGQSVLISYWKKWPKQQKVIGWGVGDASDLPVQPEIVVEGLGSYKPDPEEGRGEFVAPV